MWRLYDELIAGIPPGLAVSSYNIACRWTTVVAGGNTGVAHTTHGGGPGRLHRGPLTGMALRDAAALSKSWNFLEATLGVLYAMGWRLNVLSFGEDEARSLGVDPRRVRFAVILAATLITASSVSVAGMVGWVGLVIPHLGRSLVGADFRALLPASALLGASYLLVVDDVVRNAASVEIPIGILTAILRVPFFLAVYRASSRR